MSTTRQRVCLRSVCVPSSPPEWRCPICGSDVNEPAFCSDTAATEGGVDARRFRPASDDFGATAGTVVRCLECGHGSLLGRLDESAVATAYELAEDPVSLREERGQVATADRDLAAVEAALGVRGQGGGRGRLLDVGCWTGSLLVAASARGWDAVGIEPSAWAAGRARERGLEVHERQLGDDGLETGGFCVVVACDVLEHLLDPHKAVIRLSELIEPGGALFVTVPDAGSRLARALGRRWWAVLPMHVQYFTRRSMLRLLEDHGFDVRSVTTHAKLFSRRYYLERLASFAPPAGPILERVAARMTAERLVGPDLRDRMAVVAVRRRQPAAP